MAVCIGLAVIAIAVFGQTVGFSFVDYDDDLYIYENPMVTRGLTFKNAVWGLTEHKIDYWHPFIGGRTWPIPRLLACGRAAII